MSDSREKYVELMHAEIDGEASDKELAALREYLTSNPDAQRAHADLAKLASILNQVEQVETPADLHASILTALPPSRLGLVTRVRNFSSWRMRFPLLQFGYALAAGVIFGVVLTGAALWNRVPLEKSDLYGTMAARENTPHFVTVEQLNLATSDLRGTVVLSQSGQAAMVVFDLDGGQPADIEIQFDGSHSGLKGFSQLPNTIRAVQAKEGNISFQSNGKQRSTLLFANEKNGASVLILKFYVGGNLVRQGTLQMPGQANP